MPRTDERVYFDRPVRDDSAVSVPVASSDSYRDTILRAREAILGMERRLERDEREGRDTSLGHLAIAREYAEFARRSAERAGGSVNEMRSATDRDNMVPVARRAASA